VHLVAGELQRQQTIAGTKTNLTWDTAEPIPIILSDETNSYIYGPENLPIEQINTSEEPTYLHHDQQGSTRLLTNREGKNVGAYAYTPYGKTEEHTGTATTPLEYDAQYTTENTGLIYLRARTYDPTTAQFLTIDPALPATSEPYMYTEADPENRADPGGLCQNPDCATLKKWLAGSEKLLQEYRDLAVAEALKSTTLIAKAKSISLLTKPWKIKEWADLLVGAQEARERAEKYDKSGDSVEASVKTLKAEIAANC